MVREEDALEAFTEISEGGDEATPEMQGAASILAAHISVRPPPCPFPSAPLSMRARVCASTICVPDGSF